ncbi:unnamed protein product [Amaranthus hypochondriacus]
MARNKTLKPLTEDPPEPESSSDEETDNEQPQEEGSAGSSDEEQDLEPREGEGDDEEDEEEEESEDDDDDEEEEPEQNPSTPIQPSNTKKLTIINSKKPVQDGSSDEDDPPVSKFKSVSKPVPEVSPPPKSRSKPANTGSSTTAEKRPAEGDEKTGTAKRQKKEKTAPGSGVGTPVVQEEGSKKLFQRLFSENDEVQILNGMIEYKARKGADPINDMEDFCAFVKKLLHVDVKRSQLMDKIRRLKKKFTNAKIKDKKIGNEHDKRLFDLSKKIWDDSVINTKDDKVSNGVVGDKDVVVKSASKPRAPKSKNDTVVTEKNKVVIHNGDTAEKGLVNSAMEEDLDVGEMAVKEKVRKRALKKMGEKGRAEIDEMWEKVAKAEWELKMMREEAQREETRRIMEALGWVKP